MFAAVRLIFWNFSYQFIFLELIYFYFLSRFLVIILGSIRIIILNFIFDIRFWIAIAQYLLLFIAILPFS